jgi:hypothetical protein
MTRERNDWRVQRTSDEDHADRAYSAGRVAGRDGEQYPPARAADEDYAWGWRDGHRDHEEDVFRAEVNERLYGPTTGGGNP